MSRHPKSIVVFLLLGCLAAGGCACTYDASMSDFEMLFCPQRRPCRPVVRPADPCYGYRPTVWHAWPECCEGMPCAWNENGPCPTTAPNEFVPRAPMPGESLDSEALPAPPEEPRVFNLPPPPT